MDRRSFLRGLGSISGAALAGSLLSACSDAPEASRPTTTTAARSTTSSSTRAAAPSGAHEVDGLVVADWVKEENARPGTTRWVIHGAQGTPRIEGFLDKASALAGEELTLYVNTDSARFHAEVYRIGYYGGRGGRLLARSPELVGRVQPAPVLVAPTRTVECHWLASYRFAVGEDWPSGAYLVKLVGERGALRHVPFCVRDDESRAAYVVQSSVATWQAYNLYGGYSLYGGPGGSGLAGRSYAVSFDRPYESPSFDANGSGDFLGNELPLVFLAERHGLDVTYWTDLDLHARPALLANHRCLVSLGHDEYWSATMRDEVSAAVRGGLNLAVLGANACYRQIRVEASPLGPDRRVVCYKDASLDPVARRDPALATGGSWATDPVARPENDLIGLMYQSYSGTFVPMVVAQASSWVFAGTGLADGDEIGGLVGSEFDNYEPRLAGNPDDVTILAHSPTTSVSGPSHSDMAYHAKPGGGGVFATGTARWVQTLWDGPPDLDKVLEFGPQPRSVGPVTTVTLNVLRAFGSAPASTSHPSFANWRRFYSPDAALVPARDVT